MIRVTDEQARTRPSDDWAKAVCRVGKGAACCRFLLIDPNWLGVRQALRLGEAPDRARHHQENDVGGLRQLRGEGFRLKKDAAGQDPLYLGDGVFASHDGFKVHLSVNTERNRVIALEPEVFVALTQYAMRIWKRPDADNPEGANHE